MQPSAQYRKTPPPPSPAPVAAGEARPAVADDDDPPYLAAWLSYRKRWREIWITGVIGWLVIAALVAIFPRFQGGETVLSLLFPIWGIFWFVGSLIALLRIIGFSCPRCGNTFLNPLVTPLAQFKCRSCGLRKFHVDDHGTSLYRLLRLRKKTPA
jgi:hypothetical protein